MNPTEMIERYIYAATRRLPRASREDVARELRSIIEDMLQERCGNAPPAERDVRIVLAELGSPASLHAKYSPGKSLIGPEYFSQYCFLLRIALVCAAGGLLLAHLAALLFDPDFHVAWYDVLGNVLLGVVFVFAFVTAIFALFERKGIRISEDSIDHLPPVPKKVEQIPRSECAFVVALCVVFVVVFIAFPQLICFYNLPQGSAAPIFDAGALSRGWPLIAAFAALGVIRECFKLIDGRYTRRVLWATILCNALSAAVACIWLLQGNLMSQQFLAATTTLFADDPAFLSAMFAHFHYFFLGILLFALALDVGTTIFRYARRSDRATAV